MIFLNTISMYDCLYVVYKLNKYMGFSTYYAHLRMEVATESEVMLNLVFMKEPPYNGPETLRAPSNLKCAK